MRRQPPPSHPLTVPADVPPVLDSDKRSNTAMPAPETTAIEATPVESVGVCSPVPPPSPPPGAIDAIPTSPIPDNTEEAQEGSAAIPDDPVERVQTRASGQDESKSEDDESQVVVDMNVFDGDDFMEGLKNDKLFGPVDEDDINLIDSPSTSDSESDAKNEDVMADNATSPVVVDGVQDLADVQMDEHAFDNGLFDMTDDGLRDIAESGWVVYDEEHSGQLQLPAATDYYHGPWGPTRSAVAYANSPLGMFFYFLPKELLIRIADETNLCRNQNIVALASSRRAKRLTRQAEDPRVSVPDLDELEESLRKFKRIKPYEIVHVIALLFARAIAPVRDGLAKHWSTEEDGAIPRGTFSRFMKHARFEDIIKYLHFNKNEDGGAHVDRAWKVRPLLQAVEKTFQRGYRLGKVISFDEGMTPNRSKYNPMRVYMPDMPSKYGTKFYLTCCAETANCSRAEIYCGANKKKKKKKSPSETLGVGPKAGVRNISKALVGQPLKRLVVTDSFYSTVALSLKMLQMGLYQVGTTRIDRLGWCPMHFTQSKRPKRMPRGTYRIAQARDHPELVALSWMDSKPVNMLATGCSTQLSNVLRTEQDGSRSTVPCPQLVVDYGLGMGGVDIHDKLRLQRYSIQKSVSLRKYYKQLFLRIVDMAVVNGYIVHCITLKKKGDTPPTHADYLRRLHNQLLALRSVNFETHMNAEDLVSVPIPQQEHTLVNTEAFYTSSKQNKRRQYLCKVCSVFADTKTKSFETSFFCARCSDTFGGYVPLCRHTRRVETGNTLTCSQIWHETWNNGKHIPLSLKKKDSLLKAQERQGG